MFPEEVKHKNKELKVNETHFTGKEIQVAISLGTLHNAFSITMYGKTRSNLASSNTDQCYCVVTKVTKPVHKTFKEGS